MTPRFLAQSTGHVLNNNIACGLSGRNGQCPRDQPAEVWGDHWSSWRWEETPGRSRPADTLVEARGVDESTQRKDQ